MPPVFKQATLPNGLTVAGEIIDDAHTAAVGFFVKTGARDERTEVMGVSHFLEHMMFKGTENRTAEDVDRDFDAIGATHNAFTSHEMTAFYAHCLPERLDTSIDILADILRPSLRQADFDDEKSVILEEIAMYADQPFWVLYEQAMEAYYDAHPMAHRVLGTKQSIVDLARDQMLSYFEDRYSADNTVVSVAGRFDFDAVVEQLGQACGEWNTTRTTRQHPEMRITPSELNLTSDAVHRQYLLMIAPAPAMDDPSRYAAGILGQILGDSEGSRLYWALVDTGLAEEAEAQYDGRDGLGDYLVFAACGTGQLEQVEQVVREQLDALMDDITEDDLLRVRSKVATAATLHGELPAGRMKRLGRVWMYAGEYRSLEDELARINAVTLDDLKSVWASHPITPVVTARLSPA